MLGIVPLIINVIIVALIIFLVVKYQAINRLIRRTFTLFILKLDRRESILVIGSSKIARRIAIDSQNQSKRVVVLTDQEKNSYSDELSLKGIKTISVNNINESSIRKASITSVSHCVLASENEDHNINIANLITEIVKKSGSKNRLQLLVQVENWYSRNLLIDQVSAFGSTNEITIRFFDFHHNSAKKVYDMFPPHDFVKDETYTNNERTICIIGKSPTAESFLLENAILSQFPDNKKLRILVFMEEAKNWIGALIQRFPFLEHYLNITPIELLNSTFSDMDSWDVEFQRNILKIDAAYFFGKEDAEVISRSLNFKQFLYNKTSNLRKVPLIVTIPDNTSIFKLLSKGTNQNSSILEKYKDELLVHVIREVHDSCTYSHLISQNHIETKAKAINYFYSISYEFDHLLNTHFKKNNNQTFLNDIQEKFLNFKIKKEQPLLQIESFVIEELVKYTKNSNYRVKQYFGINESWNRVTERNKESNRYIARHLPVKTSILNQLNITEINRNNLKSKMRQLAPIEHNRWSAEKYIAGFSFGKFPENDSGLKKILKNTLKIHDQLNTMDHLKDLNHDKDIELFLIIPLLQKISDNV